MTRVQFDKLYIYSLLMVFVLAVLHTHAFAAEGQYKLTSKTVEAEISNQLSKMGAGDKVKASIVGQASKVLASNDKPLTVEISGLDFDASSRAWNASMKVTVESQLVKQVALAGRFQRMVAVPVLNRRLLADDVITKSDIIYVDLPENRLRSDTIKDVSLLVGQSPRRVISNERPIRTHEIERPVVIKRGKLLQVHFYNKGLHISTLAEAREDGAMGDVIRVQNIDSNAVMQARVLSDANAEVVTYSQLSDIRF